MNLRELRSGVALFCAAALLVEGMSFASGRVLARRGVLYQPAPLSTAGYLRYLEERDPALGWPPPGDPTLDAEGARTSSAFPDSATTPACGAVFGDSFTHGEGVADTDTWPDQLAARLGCRVANFGVSGYGSDQALLRFERSAPRGERFVVLAHLTENVMRNVNQFRGLLYAGSPFGWKPRFTLTTAGGLELVALPEISSDRYAEFVAAPERFLEHEYFAPGGPSGLAHFSPPYSLATLRAFAHFHVRSELRREPWYLRFYRPDHPSRALDITTKILSRFAREAEARGAVAVAAILPTELDLAWFEKTGRWPQEPLVAALDAEGIDAFDASSAIASRLGGRAPSELFAGAHPTAELNRWIAEIFERELARRGFARGD